MRSISIDVQCNSDLGLAETLTDMVQLAKKLSIRVTTNYNSEIFIVTPPDANTGEVTIFRSGDEYDYEDLVELEHN